MIDPPWADAEPTRGPVILCGPVYSPWVPDDVADAIKAKEAMARPSSLTENLQKGLPKNCRHPLSPSGRQSRV